MSDKSVRLYVVGEGDAELQSLIQKGLAEIGRSCEQSSVTNDCGVLLDSLSENEIPVIIKPYSAA